MSPRSMKYADVLRCAGRQIMLLFSALMLAACGGIDAPTRTPTPGLSGPTIAASPQIFLGPPTEGPPPQHGSVGVSEPTAAAQPNQGALPPLEVASPASPQQAQSVQVVALDGGLMTGDLYQNGTTRQPGVLLLGPDRAGWGDFPVQLSAAGFTVLVMSVREGGGERDVEAMIDALVSGAADPAHIAAVGASEGADFVLQGCAVMPACDSIVLLSPIDREAGLAALPQFNPRPLMLVASEEDADSYAAAQAIDSAATGDKLFQPFTSAGHGEALLTNRPDLAGLIVEWLQRQLI